MTVLPRLNKVTHRLPLAILLLRESQGDHAEYVVGRRVDEVVLDQDGGNGVSEGAHAHIDAVERVDDSVLEAEDEVSSFFVFVVVRGV